jgi:hypothetical protein
LNEYFARVTGGALENVAFKINVQSVRAAWRYVNENNLPVVDVMPEPESFVLPESQKRTVDFAQANVCKRKRNKKKKQQNLVCIIRDIVANIGEPVSYATVRSTLDESGAYEFKKGIEGYFRTRQITSAVHNHIKKYGDAALLCKTADGKIAVRN